MVVGQGVGHPLNLVVGEVQIVVEDGVPRGLGGSLQRGVRVEIELVVTRMSQLGVNNYP